MGAGGENSPSPRRRPHEQAGERSFCFFAPFVLRVGYASGRWSGGLGFGSGRLNTDFALLTAEEGLIWMLSTEAVFYE